MTQQTNTHDPAAYGETVATVVRDLALASADPKPLPASGQVAFVVPAGATATIVDLEEHAEQYAPNPRRKKGTVVTYDPESLVAYVNRHSSDNTEVWADPTTGKIVGVLDGHQGNDTPVSDEGALAGWGQHTVNYTVTPTDAWKLWMAQDGKFMSQVQFAHFIEDNAKEIETPDPATMLELAQRFEANKTVEFTSSDLLQNGEKRLVYKETLEARAGQGGEITIPSEFVIIIQPFEGAAGYRIVARFRYRIDDQGHLSLGYKLERPDHSVREAFNDVVDNIRPDLADGVPLFIGRP
jgi:uncharacterized protein YfdQ (DUF2303 family)